MGLPAPRFVVDSERLKDRGGRPTPPDPRDAAVGSTNDRRQAPLAPHSTPLGRKIIRCRLENEKQLLPFFKSMCERKDGNCKGDETKPSGIATDG